MLNIKWIPQEAHGTWEYGELFILCDNQRIGDDSSSNLPTVIGFMEQLLQDSEVYDLEKFKYASAGDVFAELYDPFMVHKVYDKLASKSLLYSLPNNVISHVGDASTYNWAVILLNFKDFQRLLWGNLSDDVIHECRLPPQGMQIAFKEFIANYQK